MVQAVGGPAVALPAVTLPAEALPAVDVGPLPAEALPAEALPAEAFDFEAVRRPLRSIRSTASVMLTPLWEYFGMLGCRRRLRCWIEPKWLRTILQNRAGQVRSKIEDQRKTTKTPENLEKLRDLARA